MRKEQFEIVTRWQRNTFKKGSSLSKLAHLKEEIEELKNDLISESEHTRLEFADCLILLFGSADCAGMSYEDICNAIDEKMEINYGRKWGEANEKGYFNHIR